MQQCCTRACALVRTCRNRVAKRAQHVAPTLDNVVIVRSELTNVGPTMLGHVVLICCDSLAEAKLKSTGEAWKLGTSICILSIAILSDHLKLDKVIIAHLALVIGAARPASVSYVYVYYL